MEQLDLDTPIPTPVGDIINLKIEELRFVAGSKPKVIIRMVGNNNEVIVIKYFGLLAKNIIKALNTANLSVKSLKRRVFEKLVADGFLNGTVSGVPE